MKYINKTVSDASDLQQELLELRYKIEYIQAGRVYRITALLGLILSNPAYGIRHPIRAFKKLSKIPSLFTKKPMPKPNFLELAAFSGPQNLRGQSSLLKYPYYKIACMGTATLFDKVAFAFEVDDVYWENSLELGIDALVIDVNTYKKGGVKAKKWLRLFKDNKVPIVAILNLGATLTPELKKAAKLVLSNNYNDSFNNNRPMVDITKFNPVGWQRSPNKNILGFGAVPKEFGANSAPIDNILEHKNCKAAIVNETSFNKLDFLNLVYKLVSSGIPTLTFSSRKTCLPKELPIINCSNASQLKIELERLEDKEYRERYSVKARRYIHLNYSQLNYFEWLLPELGLPIKDRPLISIVCSTMRPQSVKQLLVNIKEQNYDRKELLLILHGDNFNLAEIEKYVANINFPIKLIPRQKSTIFGENLNLAIDQSRGQYVTKMDDDDYYGPEHLNDLLAAFLYSGADIVGKWANWVYLKGYDQTISWSLDREESFGGHLPGATIFMERSLIDKVRFGRVPRAIDSELYNRLEMIGGRLYATHRYNFVRVRHGEHTYKKPDEIFLANSDSKKYKGYNNNNCFV